MTEIRWCGIHTCYREPKKGKRFCEVHRAMEPPAPPPPPKLPKPPRPPMWTRDSIISAIRRWVDEHGRVPIQTDWVRRGDYYPCFSTVVGHFGSWTAGLQAAGFEPGRRAA